jgi:hypothetical protein
MEGLLEMQAMVVMVMMIDEERLYKVKLSDQMDTLRNQQEQGQQQQQVPNNDTGWHNVFFFRSQ